MGQPEPAPIPFQVGHAGPLQHGGLHRSWVKIGQARPGSASAGSGPRGALPGVQGPALEPPGAVGLALVQEPAGEGVLTWLLRNLRPAKR